MSLGGRWEECSSQRLPDWRQHCLQKRWVQRWLAVREQLEAAQQPMTPWRALRDFLDSESMELPDWCCRWRLGEWECLLKRLASGSKEILEMMSSARRS